MKKIAEYHSELFWSGMVHFVPSLRKKKGYEPWYPLSVFFCITSLSTEAASGSIKKERLLNLHYRYLILVP